MRQLYEEATGQGFFKLSSAPQQASGWQPMDTAPKDKTTFLAFGHGHGNGIGSYDMNEKSFPMFSICFWNWHEGTKDVEAGNGLFRKEPCRVLESWNCAWGFTPTHWQPLPAAPDKASGKLREGE